ncbi:MAG: FeoB-associated Cys-rich membrane protein, partial [Lachnospiraceae bacterium]|nr:FeoB-associated Cys-rich membrane protein [Lachnospiraceae bacterium]
MGTVAVGAILVVIVAAILHSMYKDKKAGKSLQCG